jgi:hypothetical protein
MNENADIGGRPPGEAGAAASNADLWTTYLRGQARSWIDPFGIGNREAVDAVARPLADMAAIAISGWFSLFAARPTAALYRQNAPGVSRFVAEQSIDADAIEIPPQFAAPRRAYPAPFETTQIEAWRLTPPRPREPIAIR